MGKYQFSRLFTGNLTGLGKKIGGQGGRTIYERGVATWSFRDGLRVFPADKPPTVDTVPAFREVVPGSRVYRSGKLSDASRYDRATLAEALRWGKIIDLRTPGRAEKEPDPDLDRVKRHHLPLPPTSYVPYADLIRTDKPTLRAVLGLMAEPGPVLVHCTEGKDRTGIVVALAMLAAGYSEKAIMEEFLRTPLAPQTEMQFMFRQIRWEAPGDWVSVRDGLNLDPAVRDALRDRIGRNRRRK